MPKCGDAPKNSTRFHHVSTQLHPLRSVDDWFQCTGTWGQDSAREIKRGAQQSRYWHSASYLLSDAATPQVLRSGFRPPAKSDRLEIGIGDRLEIGIGDRL